MEIFDYIKARAAEKEGRARDKPCGESAISEALIPGVEMTVQKNNITKPVKCLGRSYFPLCLLPCPRRGGQALTD